MGENSTVKVTILGKAKDGMRAMHEYSAALADVIVSTEVKGQALDNEELTAAKALLKAKFEDDSE